MALKAADYLPFARAGRRRGGSAAHTPGRSARIAAPTPPERPAKAGSLCPDNKTAAFGAQTFASGAAVWCNLINFR